MLARARSIALLGMDGYPIDVEVSLAQGLPTFTIVGLPDLSIQEARERVRAAIQACGEQWPQHRITVNLAPAHLRKTGSGFDLAVAFGVLAASGRIDADRLGPWWMLGELSLDGRVQRVRGVLPAVMAAARAGARKVFVPSANAREAALIREIEVFPLDHLARGVRFLRGECDLDPVPFVDEPALHTPEDSDFRDVRGNGIAKRACEVAAAGGHNLLMRGAPGGGKTMLARRMATILPPMSEEESFEVTRIYSVAGLLSEDAGLIARRPFRAPHHSSSTTGMIGGGSGVPHPGEVSLAHRGILFLDEFGEFRREVTQALRQPLEDGVITIVRSKWAVQFPARFQLVAATNPCPCGFADDPIRPCVCALGKATAYRERLAGPVMDRVDLQVNVARLNKHELFASDVGEYSEEIRARVSGARKIQLDRYRGGSITCNAELPARNIEIAARLDADALDLIQRTHDGSAMTARATHRTIRVARTIADLAGEGSVTIDHMDEALQYRLLDQTR